MFEDELVVCIQDRFPVAAGHLLVVPRRHVQRWAELTAAEGLAVVEAIERARAEAARAHAPDGFTIGINDGPAAGQTVPHLHAHVIPRRAGDVTDPRGGIRWVIPDRARYW